MFTEAESTTTKAQIFEDDGHYAGSSPKYMDVYDGKSGNLLFL